MRQPFDYCERIVREHDRDRFLATLFAPADKRPALLALYAFEIEVGRIPFLVSQPMAGEVRLQWWREVLQGDRPEEAAASPVASALDDIVRAESELQPALEAFLDSVSHDLHGEQIRTINEFDAHASQSAAMIIESAMRVLAGFRSHEGAMVARHAAAAMLSVQILGGGAPSLRERLAGDVADASPLRAHAQYHYERARALLPRVSAAALPALLPLALVPAQLRALPGEPPQWRRQWIMWRAARRGRL